MSIHLSDEELRQALGEIKYREIFADEENDANKAAEDVEKASEALKKAREESIKARENRENERLKIALQREARAQALHEQKITRLKQGKKAEFLTMLVTIGGALFSLAITAALFAWVIIQG